ncbi:hypothetical protein [Lentzea terrae]|uniref:hypothetical protein n=1 Tax=Lentzea terrae TaxID=2200761 RepID=UPI000DD41F36|nr:hypothetical protein [Lentzea terrae]
MLQYLEPRTDVPAKDDWSTRLALAGIRVRAEVVEKRADRLLLDGLVLKGSFGTLEYRAGERVERTLGRPGDERRIQGLLTVAKAVAPLPWWHRYRRPDFSALPR